MLESSSMRVFAAALAVLLAGCSGSSSAANRLPDVRLKTLGGPAGPSLASCPTEKCLTVVVAPWCGICHASAPAVVSLRRWLDRRGVGSRVVVGLSDDAKAIRAFAAEFGPDALLDPDGAVRPRGVPLFLVTDAQGKVLKAVNGFPAGARGPEDLAGMLGLL